MTTLPIKSNGETHNLVVDESYSKKYSDSSGGLSGAYVIARRYGRIVQIIFNYTGTAETNKWYNVCTLDEEFRPTEYVVTINGVYTGMLWYSDKTMRLQVLPSGVVRVEAFNTEFLERSVQVMYIIA